MLPPPRTSLAALFLCGTALPLTAVSAGAASLTPVNPMLPDTPYYIYALSADGEIAGGSSENANGDQAAVIWGMNFAPITDGSWVGNSSVAGHVTAINSTGSVYVYNLVNGDDEAIAIRGPGAYSLYSPFNNNNGDQQAFGLSSDGSIVVGRSDSSAVYWSWNGVNAYGPGLQLSGLGGASSIAYGVSGDDSIIVGHSRDAGGAQRAAVWSGAGYEIQSLDPGELYPSSGAAAISSDGSTIVGYVYNDSVDTAAIWTGDTYQTSTLIAPLGATASKATAVSADGSIVGGNYEMTPAPGSSRAFLWSNGKAGDLGTMLSDAGLDVTGITLNQLTALSGDGQLMTVNDAINQKGYVVMYDGDIAGLTTVSSQVASADPVLAQRQAVAMQPDLYAGIIAGDLQPADAGSEVGAFGLYGSAAGGARATGVIDANWSVSGGLSLGTGDYGALAYQGVVAAGVVRYDADPFANGFNLFGQAGGSVSLLDPLTFHREYANGAGTATGIGVTSGTTASIFARLGVRGELSETDQLSASAEIGQRWLATAAYSETASAQNPFPASFGAATDTATTGKLAATWTHQFTPALDMTLRGAIGMTLAGSTDLKMSVSGAGAAQPDHVGDRWVEAGLRLGWKATETTRLDLYATGMAGTQVGVAGHVGAGLSVGF